MSKTRGQANNGVVPQSSHRSIAWPRDRLYDEWQKKNFVTAVAFGPVPTPAAPTPATQDPVV